MNDLANLIGLIGFLNLTLLTGLIKIISSITFSNNSLSDKLIDDLAK